MQYPKVLIGVPISDLHSYCFDEFINSLKQLTYPNYDILLLDNSRTNHFYIKIKKMGISVIKTKPLKRIRSSVTRDHNLLRKKVLKEKYDYLLILDQDVIIPKDALEKLISYEKDLIAGLYFGHHIVNNQNVVMPFAWVFTERKGHWGSVRYLNPNEIWNHGLIKIAFSGAGCILIHRKVLEKIKFRYKQNIDAWDDRWLGYDAYKAGFEFFLDNTVKCKHLYMKRPFDYQDLRKKNLV